jgi:tryptophanyl-tRNA synthetase
VKQAIFDRFMEKFASMRERRKQLENEPEHVEEILKKGVEQVRRVALPLMKLVRDAVGIRNIYD